MHRAEFETKLNRVCLHIYKEEHYEEDYQMPMLRQNRLDGILEVEGCEVEGKARYTYEISGMVSMKSMYENTCIKKREIQNIVTRILEVTETLQEYMLNPNCLVLKPEYIFYRDGQWFFCYFPDMQEDLCRLFHELTEYFVRMLDYEDTEGIFLAYELHKATLQEHYDLGMIMKEYKSHEMERKKVLKEKRGIPGCKNKESCKSEKSRNENKEIYKNRKDEDENQIVYENEKNKQRNQESHKSKEYQKANQEAYRKEEYQKEDRKIHEGKENKKENYCEDYAIYGKEGKLYQNEVQGKGIGSIFCVTDEEDRYEKKQNHTIYEKYEPEQKSDAIQEKGGWWKSWRKAANGIRRKRWGSWEDLILETDGQEDENGL